MVNTNKIRGLMAEHGINQAQIARKLGVSQSTVLRKLKTGKFGIDEAEILIRELHIEDPCAIFFAKSET